MRLDLCKVVPSGMRIGVRDKGQGTTLGILVSDTSFSNVLNRVPRRSWWVRPLYGWRLAFGQAQQNGSRIKYSLIQA